MEGSVEDLGAPESWEVADLDESMSRLMLSSKKDSKPAQELSDSSASASVSASSASVASNSVSADGEDASDDVFNQVDQFLREALQNPRERLSSKPICVFSYVFLRRVLEVRNSFCCFLGFSNHEFILFGWLIM
jgi:hypothetical protein